jgi:hypothetical protein
LNKWVYSIPTNYTFTTSPLIYVTSEPDLS